MTSSDQVIRRKRRPALAINSTFYVLELYNFNPKTDCQGMEILNH